MERLRKIAYWVITHKAPIGWWANAVAVLLGGAVQAGAAPPTWAHGLSVAAYVLLWLGSTAVGAGSVHTDQHYIDRQTPPTVISDPMPTEGPHLLPNEALGPWVKGPEGK